MSDYIAIYFADDDTAVSLEDVFDNPVTFELRADLEEVGDPVELYAEATEGYIVYDAEVFPTGDTASKWKLALTEVGLATAVWGDSLNIGTVENGAEGQVTFFIQAKAINTETPTLDDSVTLYIEGLAEPVV